MKKRKISKRIIVITIIFVLVLSIIIGFWLFPTRDVQEYTTARVEKTKLVQTVSEVGSVKSAKEIELNFGQSGKIDKLHTKIGEIVKKDQILAELDYKILSIKKTEAESNMEQAQANLAKTRAGATRQDIAVLEAQVNAASQNYRSAEETLEKTKDKVAESVSQAEKTLNDLESDSLYDITSYEQSVSSAKKNLSNTKSTYQNSIDNKKDALITVISSKLSVANTALDDVDSIISNSDIRDYLSSKDTSYLAKTETAYEESIILWSKAKTSLALVESNRLDTYTDSAATDALAVLNKTSDTLDFCYKVLEYSSLSQTDADNYKASISVEISAVSTGLSALETADQNLTDARLAYQTNVSSYEEALKTAQVALSDAVTSAENALSTAKTTGDKEIVTAESSVASAKESWDVAKSQLKQIQAPARYEDITLYQSKVKQARASLDLIEKQIEDSILKSPIAGKVINIQYEEGEQVGQSAPAISVLAENNFEIEVDISESDISKVNVGDTTYITLDAFSEDVEFAGVVEFVEPAETIIQDVIYYKVTVVFTEKQEKLLELRSGMTANVDIATDIKENVLVVPSRAVLEKNDKKYIRIWKKGVIEEHEVTLGLRGDGGYVEIQNSVNVGDEVVTYVKEMKKRVFRY